MSIKDYWQKIKGQFLAREGAIFLTLVVILTGSLGFGLGRLSKIEENRPPIRIEKAVSGTNNTDDGSRQIKTVGGQVGQGSGEVVASKSGKNYYYPWCSGVSRIKPANKVFFPSSAAAAAAGLFPAKNCPGLPSQ